MAEFTFPVLANDMRPDSGQYEVSIEDPSMAPQGMEGGYEYTRPRFKRYPRLMWKIGYRDLTDEHKQQLWDFWAEQAKGGSVIFEWFNHEDEQTYEVRFMGNKPLSFQYKGVGLHRRWNCSFELKQA